MSLFTYQPYETETSYETKASGYDVRRISYMEARRFVEKHHYLGGMSNAATGCYGLFDGIYLLGVLAFATPCSEAVRRMVFGPDHCPRVTELHRLVILDDAAPINTDPAHAANTESWFIARCLNALKADKPHLWGVVSFADSGHGHVGTIYQATNGLYYGPSRGEPSFVDAQGRVHSRRQCKINLTALEAAARGWTRRPASRKHRYLFRLPDDRRHARTLQSAADGGLLQLAKQDYPKQGSSLNRRIL